MAGTDGRGRREFLRATGAAGAAAALPVSVQSAGGRRSEETDGERERPRVAVVGLSDPAAVEEIDADLPDGVEVLDRSRSLRYVRVALPEGDGAYDRLRIESRLAAAAPVKYVEYDEPMPVLATTGAPEPVTPADPRFDDQYAPQDVNAPAAWGVLEAVTEERVREEEVVVAVVDTGTDYEHADLREGFDDDPGHDCVDRWFWKSPDDDPAPSGDDEYHGTHVTGIVGATRNATGVSGVSGATLRSYRAIGADGMGRPTDVANAIRRAVDEGADVINMSLGFVVPTFVVRDAVSYAVEEGVLPVAAAGNQGDAPGSLPDPVKDAWRAVDSRTHVWYPGAYDDCLCVSAVDRYGRLAGYSKYGDEVDVTAPGSNVLSTMPGDDYAELSGTSMAAPVVAGVAALVRRRFPDLSVGELRARLLDTAEDLGLAERKQGAGRVDALRAVSDGTLAETASGADRGVTTEYEGSLDDGEEWTGVHELRTRDPRTVTVSLVGPENADLDLYCTLDGSEPDEGEFDRRSWTVGSRETVELTDPGGVSTLGLLVDAFSGGGRFRLTVTERPRSAGAGRTPAVGPRLDVDGTTGPGTRAFAVDVPDADDAVWTVDGTTHEGRVAVTELAPGDHRVAVAVDGRRHAETVTVTESARAGRRRHVETYEGRVRERARFVHEPAPTAERVTVRVAAVDGPADLDLYAAREGRASTESFDAAGRTVTDRERVTVTDPEGAIDLLVDRVAGETGRVRVLVTELRA